MEISVMIRLKIKFSWLATMFNARARCYAEGRNVGLATMKEFNTV
jgi:hypothetical protein